jgi:hypothetical protein
MGARPERDAQFDRYRKPAGRERTAALSNGRAPMMSEVQVHTVARQMLERHGFAAIAKAAEQAQACEGRGEADDAKEWRHIEDAMKIIRGPHQS